MPPTGQKTATVAHWQSSFVLFWPPVVRFVKHNFLSARDCFSLSRLRFWQGRAPWFPRLMRLIYGWNLNFAIEHKLLGRRMPGQWASIDIVEHFTGQCGVIMQLYNFLKSSTRCECEHPSECRQDLSALRQRATKITKGIREIKNAQLGYKWAMNPKWSNNNHRVVCPKQSGKWCELDIFKDILVNWNGCKNCAMQIKTKATCK